MAHGLDLLRELENAHAEVYLLLLADGERVRVHERTPHSLERSKHGGQVIKRAYVAIIVSLLCQMNILRDTHP